MRPGGHNRQGRQFSVSRSIARGKSASFCPRMRPAGQNHHGTRWRASRSRAPGNSRHVIPTSAAAPVTPRRLLLVPRQATGNSIASETNRCRGSSMSKNRPTHSESVPGRPVPATVRPQSPIGATASMPTPRPDKPPSNNRRALDTADGFDPRSRQAHPCSCVSIRGSRPEAERTLRRGPGMSRRYGNASTFVVSSSR